MNDESRSASLPNGPEGNPGFALPAVLPRAPRRATKMLTRQADARQPSKRRGRLGAQMGNRFETSLPPFFRILFGPKRMRPRDRDRDIGFSNDFLCRVDKQRFDRRGANVKPEISAIAHAVPPDPFAPLCQNRTAPSSG